MRRVVLVAAAVFILAACGVPDDGQPRALDPGNVPFELLAPTASATSTTAPSRFTITRPVSIYLADADGHLVATRRQVPAPAHVSRVINTLLLGPTTDEADRLHTAITSSTRLRHVNGPRDGLVTVDLSSKLLDITGRQQILALAQVVFTVTSLADVDRVLFKFDGQQREVPNGEGTLTGSPLRRLSYRQLVGPG